MFPNHIDIILLWLGLFAWTLTFLSGKDTLYKLFLGLIIGFLAYLVVASQMHIATLLEPSQLQPHHKFLLENTSTSLLGFLLTIPLFGIFFMLHPGIHIHTKAKSPSHILLWLLLPILLIGMLANLWNGSILSDYAGWKNIFSFFEKSMIYELFTKFPWALLLLFMTLLFYKAIFLVLLGLIWWFYRQVILWFFKSWGTKKSNSSYTPSNEGSSGIIYNVPNAENRIEEIETEIEKLQSAKNLEEN